MAIVGTQMSRRFFNSAVDFTDKKSAQDWTMQLSLQLDEITAAINSCLSGPISVYQNSLSNVTSHIYSPLSSTNDAGYKFEVFFNSNTLGANISLVLNNDTTATNYWLNTITNNAGTLTAAANNSNVVATTASTFDQGYMNGELASYPNALCVFSFTTWYYLNGVWIQKITNGMYYPGTVPTVTSFGVMSSVTNGLTQATIRLWRRRSSS